jgi:hypothetical protein
MARSGSKVSLDDETFYQLTKTGMGDLVEKIEGEFSGVKLACRATKCKFNVDGKCGLPAERIRVNSSWECDNFTRE